MSNGKAEPKATEPVAIKKSILIAEDSIPNQKVLQHILIKLGFDVVATKDGVEAWAKLNSEATRNFVCVISDLMMPEENGLSLLRHVRESEKFKTLPFVFVTALAEKEYIQEAKSLGINGYILKPMTLFKVQGKLKELFPYHDFPKLAAA